MALAFSPLVLAQGEAPSQTLFTNVHIFDGVDEARMAGNVLVEGNMIKQVSAEAINAPGATVVDGGGRTLMPGLIDMHTHTGLRRGVPDTEFLWDGQAVGAMAHQTMMQYFDMGYTTMRDICAGSLGVARAIAAGACWMVRASTQVAPVLVRHQVTLTGALLQTYRANKAIMSAWAM